VLFSLLPLVNKSVKKSYKLQKRKAIDILLRMCANRYTLCKGRKEGRRGETAEVRKTDESRHFLCAAAPWEPSLDTIALSALSLVRLFFFRYCTSEAR
jgi:hypothetical protein